MNDSAFGFFFFRKRHIVLRCDVPLERDIRRKSFYFGWWKIL